jgi:hypothetical protein
LENSLDIKNRITIRILDREDFTLDFTKRTTARR